MHYFGHRLYSFHIKRELRQCLPHRIKEMPETIHLHRKKMNCSVIIFFKIKILFNIINAQLSSKIYLYLD